MPEPSVEKEITRRYADGERTKDLAQDFGVGINQIARIVRRNGGEVRGKGANRLPPEREAELVRLYAEGVPVADLRKKFGVAAASTIPRIVKRYGVEVRPGRRPQRRFTEAEVVEMGRLWNEEGLSQTAIALRFDTAQIVVSRVLRSAGIKPVARHPRPRGEQHGSWKGGRSTHGAGYVLVSVDPNDPLAAMRNRSGYVAEHRLVMARALGRPLSSNETVHHLNGDRKDNRLENLQLRHGPHGKGARFRCCDCGSTNVEPLDL